MRRALAGPDVKAPRAPHVFLACGEASGDRYGAALTTALRALMPNIRVTALGGPQLAAAGAEIIVDASELAFMGFSDIARNIPTIWRVRQRLWEHLKSGGVDLSVPIDFPGFNARLAGHSHRCGVPVFWLVAPQVWAWGSWRTKGLRQKIDRLGTILPFEQNYFCERGFDVFPMGHPLMEDYGAGYSFRESHMRREKALNSRKGPLTIGILPGSRRQELEHLLPTLKVTCQAVMGHLPGREIRFVVSVAPGVDTGLVHSVFDGQFEFSTEPLPQLLSRLDLALVCSGTASLEVALAGVPHEIVYRTGAVNAFIARRLVRTRHIGLSNLILDRRVVREHFQAEATPLRLARDLLRWLVRPAERQIFDADVSRLRDLCGAEGVWERVADEVLRMVRAEPMAAVADRDS